MLFCWEHILTGHFDSICAVWFLHFGQNLCFMRWHGNAWRADPLFVRYLCLPLTFLFVYFARAFTRLHAHTFSCAHWLDACVCILRALAARAHRAHILALRTHTPRCARAFMALHRAFRALTFAFFATALAFRCRITFRCLLCRLLVLLLRFLRRYPLRAFAVYAFRQIYLTCLFGSYTGGSGSGICMAYSTQPL